MHIRGGEGMKVQDKKKHNQKCDHHPMCISVVEYGVCENEDPDYNDPKHCEYDTRFYMRLNGVKKQ